MSSSDGRVDHKTLVLQATDIVALIGRTVALKKRGKDYVGLCPFHNEKSPSFTVSPTRQFFHCYGCKEGGNAIDFVMKRDRVEFLDALKSLAGEAGIEITRSGAGKQKAGEKQLLLDASSAAASFFQRMLADPERGRAAREYLEHRGFSDESVTKFQIGLAVEAWDALLKGPVGRKFTPPQLVTAGLAKARENGSGFYDTFRNRLMFPIRDETGRVIAFGGRVMPGSQDPAKYLNSPETPLFSKSRCVFGLDLARQKIVETRTVVVVEGYTDVVMAHQYGVTNVVSILGTAMTEQHVTVLRRFADRIVLLFDADTAGDTAVDRAVGLFLTQPIEIAIAALPEDVDPDEFLLKDGAAGWEKLIAASPDALTYKWKQLARRFEAEGGLTGQQKAVEEYLGLLSAARGSGPVDSLRWGAALARVSRLTDIPVEQLHRQFRTKRAPARPGGPNKSGGPAARQPIKAVPAGLNAPGGPNAAEGSEPAGESRTGETGVVPRGPRGVLSARQRAERWILGILLKEPGWWRNVQKHVAVEDFADDLHRRLAQVYWDYQRDEGEPVFNEFLGMLTPAQRELAIEADREVDTLPDPRATLAQAVSHLDEERQRREKGKLIAELRRTSDEPLPEQDEVALFRQLQEKARRPDLRRA